MMTALIIAGALSMLVTLFILAALVASKRSLSGRSTESQIQTVSHESTAELIPSLAA